MKKSEHLPYISDINKRVREFYYDFPNISILALEPRVERRSKLTFKR